MPHRDTLDEATLDRPSISWSAMAATLTAYAARAPGSAWSTAAERAPGYAAPVAAAMWHRPQIVGWRKNGSPIYTIAGAADPPPPDPTPPDPPRTFTQDEVNRMMTAEKNQGRTAAISDIAQQLGCTVDEAKAKLTQADEAQRQKMSEIEKREADAKKREDEATARDQRAAAVEFNAKLTLALVQAGAAPKTVDDSLALLKVRGVDAKSDDAALKKAIDDVREAVPALFGTPTDANGQRPPSYDAKAPARPGVPKPDWGQAGLDEAKRRGFVKEPAKV